MIAYALKRVGQEEVGGHKHSVGKCVCVCERERGGEKEREVLRGGIGFLFAYVDE